MRLLELFEALDKEQKRWLYTHLKNIKYDRHRWAELFQNKYRLYFPYEGEYESSIDDSTSYDHVAFVLEHLGKLNGEPWRVEDYLKGIATRREPSSATIDKIATYVNRPELYDQWKNCVQMYRDNQDNNSEVSALLRELQGHGYHLIPSTEDTFMKGLFTKYQLKRISIGKLLEQAIKNNLADKDIIKYFAQDPYRTGAHTKLNVVISRHPEDIGGMSTNRRWSSCMNLDSGINRRYVPADIAEGTLVAYLIDEKDKKIETPLARILIKPFINIKDGSVALGVQDKMYPSTAPAAFGQQVSNWADSVNASRELNGIFKLSDKAYSDDWGKNVLRVGDVEENNDFIETMKPQNLMLLIKKMADSVEEYLNELISDMELNDDDYYSWLSYNFSDEYGDIDYERVNDEEATYRDYNPDVDRWVREVMDFFSGRDLTNDIYDYAKNYLSENGEMATTDELPEFLSELADFAYKSRMHYKDEIVDYIKNLSIVKNDNDEWEVKS